MKNDANRHEEERKVVVVSQLVCFGEALGLVVRGRIIFAPHMGVTKLHGSHRHCSIWISCCEENESRGRAVQPIGKSCKGGQAKRKQFGGHAQNADTEITTVKIPRPCWKP